MSRPFVAATGRRRQPPLARVDRGRSRAVVVLASCLLVAASRCSASAAEAPAVRWSGYLQAQMLRDVGEGTNLTEQDVRRARIKVESRVSPRAAVTLQLDLAREVELRDAYADLTASRGVDVRVGQLKVPFSHQILESSSVRIAPERALVNTRLFPSERDRGLAVFVRLTQRLPLVAALGVLQGAGPNRRDNNNDKDLLASLHYGGRVVSVRASYYKGTFTNAATSSAPASSVARDRYGFDAVFAQPGWSLEGQWTRGKGDHPGPTTVTPARVEGWYAQATHRVSHVPLFPYVRYQSYDPDRDRGGNTITGLEGGVAWDAAGAVRYTVAWERRDDAARGGRRDILTSRAQVRY